MPRTLWTQSEKEFIVAQRDSQKPWREIETLFNERFPEHRRSRKALQTQYQDMKRRSNQPTKSVKYKHRTQLNEGGEAAPVVEAASSATNTTPSKAMHREGPLRGTEIELHSTCKIKIEDFDLERSHGVKTDARGRVRTVFKLVISTDQAPHGQVKLCPGWKAWDDVS